MRLVGEEVEHGPVVPEPVPAGRTPVEDVVTEPGNRGGRADPSTGLGQRGLGDVHDRQVDEAALDQTVDEQGGPATDVDDRGQRFDTERFDQFEGRSRLGLVPADRLEALAPIGLVPVGRTFG